MQLRVGALLVRAIPALDEIQDCGSRLGLCVAGKLLFSRSIMYHSQSWVAISAPVRRVRVLPTPCGRASVARTLMSKKRVLITGITGQDGSYLASDMQQLSAQTDG